MQCLQVDDVILILPRLQCTVVLVGVVLKNSLSGTIMWQRASCYVVICT